jgi:hypothetical protein
MSDQFFEVLPDQCPPNDAQDYEYPNAFRFVNVNSIKEISDQHFASHAALGENKPAPVNDCDWAACSLFNSSTCRDLVRVSKLQKFKNKSLARISIPTGSGQSVLSIGGHINLWSFANCKLSSLVKGIE